MTSINVETFKVDERTRQDARDGKLRDVWKSKYVVRFSKDPAVAFAAPPEVLGGGSSQRVAAMRAAQAAVAERWF